MPAIRGANSKKKCRRMTRGLDQVAGDLENPAQLEKYQKYKGDASDLPAGGLHYCIECAKWFDSDDNLVSHQKGKVHKRKLKMLKEGAHSQQEAEEATGLTRDNGIVTRRLKEEKEAAMDVDAVGSG